MPRKNSQQHTKISVVIVTRNRKKIIQECLASLAAQSVLPNEVVIIDNDSDDDTVKWVRSWGKSAPFSVKVVTEKKVGYPYVYNRGLREAKNDWIGFIDDDCIAGSQWCAQAIEAITKHPSVVTVLGFSETQKPSNIYSLATYLFHFDWKEKWTTGSTIHNYEVLDNKNIFYFYPFLKKHNIRFAEERINTVGGAAEDCVLGWQIQQAKGKAIYQRQMKVKHKDPDNWQWYWKKYFSSLAAYVSFVSERTEDDALPPPKKVPFRQNAVNFADKYGKNIFWKIHFLMIVYMSVAMSFLLKYLFSFPQLRTWYIQHF